MNETLPTYICLFVFNQKTHELLKQAWNAKGSPFAGTEFDPSKVNVSPSYG